MIYMTPFANQIATGPSVDSGFASIDDVIMVMGPPASQPTPRYAIYDGVIFSREVRFDGC